jgi:hypothetical protein
MSERDELTGAFAFVAFQQLGKLCLFSCLPLCLIIVGVTVATGQSTDTAVFAGVGGTLLCSVLASAYTMYAKRRCGERGCDNVFVGPRE